MQDTATLISKLIEEYGITGLVIGVLIGVYVKLNKKQEKRITDLERSLSNQQNDHIEAHKEMIAQYVDLVKNKTKVIMDLTGCLKAIKEAIERLERKQDG